MSRFILVPPSPLSPSRRRGIWFVGCCCWCWRESSPAQRWLWGLSAVFACLAVGGRAVGRGCSGANQTLVALSAHLNSTQQRRQPLSASPSHRASSAVAMGHGALVLFSAYSVMTAQARPATRPNGWIREARCTVPAASTSPAAKTATTNVNERGNEFADTVASHRGPQDGHYLCEMGLFYGVCPDFTQTHVESV